MAPPNDMAPLTGTPADAEPVPRLNPAALQPNIGAMVHDVARVFADKVRRDLLDCGSASARTAFEYGFAEAFTVYGKLGIKCWICKGEMKPEKPKTPEPAVLES